MKHRIYRLNLALVFWLTLTSLSAANETEHKLDGPDILTLLNGAIVTGDDWQQRFFEKKLNATEPAGTTYELRGDQSFGKWEVRGDQYCSVWPPAESWACYNVTSWIKDGKTWVVWISDNGERYEGKVLK